MDCQTTGWIKFKNQNLYNVYISEAMKRKLKSVAVYWEDKQYFTVFPSIDELNKGGGSPLLLQCKAAKSSWF